MTQTRSHSIITTRTITTPERNHLSQTTSTEASSVIHWQRQLSHVVTDIDDLLTQLQLMEHKEKVYIPNNFQLKVPQAFVNKMQKNNINDPLLCQVLPMRQERQSVSGFVTDPLAERQHNPINGLIHKYKSRILLTLTGACAVHCRYCFRQHFDYQSNLPHAEDWQHIHSYIQQHPEINEVILSGGDPLVLSPRRLDHALAQLESNEQIKTIRLHTRVPIVIPQRLDTELLNRLIQSRCKVVMVIHCNHAQEIDPTTQYHLQRFSDSRIQMLNQSVLLKGVNDNIQALVDLSEQLFNSGVLPYYLHLLDAVSGAAHFHVPKPTAITLYWQMLAQLSGYLVPKLVQEQPNQPFKMPVDLF